MNEVAADETPWAMVVRMRAENATFDAIVQGLKAKGLERDDIELLLKGSPEVARLERPPPRPAAPKVEGPAVSTAVGSPLRWAAITLAGFLATLGAAGWSGGELWGAILFAFSTLGFGALLVPELRSGLRRTARKLGYVLFFVCFVPALAGFIGGWKPWTVVGAAGLVLSIPMIVWASRTGERLRGIAELGHPGTIFESNDVQFTVRVPSDPSCAPGEAVEVQVIAQNCVDVPRSLVVEIGGRAETTIGERRHSVPVAPGSIIELVVPIRLHGLAPEFVTLVIGVSGLAAAPGRRVRLEKGAEYVTPDAALADNVLGVIAFAAVGFGMFTLGSNGTLRVKCATSKPFVDVPREPTTTVLYLPTPEELQRAARS